VATPATGEKKARVVYVNSYHHGYQWSDDIEKGLLKALGVKRRADGTIDVSHSTVELRIIRMDTKLNTSETYKQKAALEAKGVIDQWRPDAIVASDDNASKYLISPYYNNSAIPVVFCGINWDASVYGFPSQNVTGMIEVDPLQETIEILRKYARGDRVGFIGSDNISNRKQLIYHERVLGINYADGKLVNDFNAWNQEYRRMQDSVDMLIWLNPIGISGWDSQKAMAYILANTKIPTGNTGDNTRHLALVGKVKIAEEQGWWAGKTVLRILAGTSPADIPVTRNQKTRIYVNMRLANRLGIKFPIDLIEKATFVEVRPAE